MTLRTYQQISAAGLTPALIAPTTSDTVAPDDRLHLEVRTGATGTTVTVVTPGSGPAGQPEADLVRVIAANAEAKIGPLTQAFADPATNLITVNYSSVATVTHGFFRV
jgi:hypothetical protein